MNHPSAVWHNPINTHHVMCECEICLLSELQCQHCGQIAMEFEEHDDFGGGFISVERCTFCGAHSNYAFNGYTT